MNDTHRSTPAFTNVADHRQALFARIIDQVGSRVGEMMSGARDTLTTRTTSADSAQEGSGMPPTVTLWREIDALGGIPANEHDRGYTAAICAVLAILERRGFTEQADAERPYLAFACCDVRFDARGLVERITVDDPHAAPETTNERATMADGWTDKGKAWLAAGAPPIVSGGIAASMTTAAPLDPTPEEQRERFERIARTPRPPAVAIRSALLEAHWLARQWDDLGKGGNGEDTRHIAGLLDRVGVELIVLELERDALRAQLDRIAANAKPVDGADVAELVQEARRYADHNRGPVETRALAVLLDRLVGALNDQVRRLREAEAIIADAAPAVRLLNTIACLEGDALEAHASPELRDAARDANGGWLPVPPAYDEDQREAAATALSRIAARGAVASPNSYSGTSTDGERYGETVDAVASALGLVRGA